MSDNNGFIKSNIMFFLLFISMVSCNNRSNTTVNYNRHSEDYIKQRVESFYCRFNDPSYDENGKKILDNGYNYDSAYCSSRYYALLSRAIDVMDDDDILLDCDHWTDSQDYDDFTCEVDKIENITDSAATVVLSASNWGEEYTVTLSLLYEKDDWYVDDFIKKYGFKSEKAYLNDFIKRNKIWKKK